MIAALALSVAPAWQLVWRDEFEVDGPPDPKNWAYELGFVRNKEPQYYRAENVTVRGGRLIIEGRKETVANAAHDPAAPATDWKRSRKTAQFTSGSIKTAGKRTWTYGRFECRGKFDAVDGLWPAFWMTGPTRAWPGNGEIDIMEYYQKTYLANFAWASDKPNAAVWKDSKTPIEQLARSSGYRSVQEWSRAFHVYRMDWSVDSIELYVDNWLLNQIRVSEAQNASPDGAHPFREPHHLILNLAIGATGGDPSVVQWPARFVVDWVRVYQRL